MRVRVSSSRVLLATSTLLLSGFAWSQEPVRQEIERVRERVIVTADRAEQTEHHRVIHHSQSLRLEPPQFCLQKIDLRCRLLNEPRQLDMIAAETTQFLRIGAEQFLSVVESDKTVLLSLLRTVAGHLTGVATVLAARGIELPRDFGPPPPAILPRDGRT